MLDSMRSTLICISICIVSVYTVGSDICGAIVNITTIGNDVHNKG